MIFNCINFEHIVFCVSYQNVDMYICIICNRFQSPFDIFNSFKFNWTQSAFMAAMIYAAFTVALMAIFTIIGISHFTAMYKQHKQNLRKLPFRSNLTFLLIFLAILQMIDFLLVSLPANIIGGWFCQIEVISGPTNVILFKAILYVILLSRLWAANGTFDYNPFKMKLWTIFILSWSLINILVANLSSVSNYNGPEAATKCDQFVQFYALALVAGLDFISGIVNIILFTRPLFKLYKQINDTDLKSIAVKQCILSIIAVASTLIGVILIGITNEFVIIIGIDYMVSISSVLLMYKWNSWLTDRLLWCCLQSPNADADIKNLEMVVNNPSKSAVSSKPDGTYGDELTLPAAGTVLRMGMSDSIGLPGDGVVVNDVSESPAMPDGSTVIVGGVSSGSVGSDVAMNEV